jgi:hypothetical protein
MRKLGLFLLLTLVVGGVSDAAGFTLGPRHKDESNGFQIQVPSKWEQVPTKFQDVVLVGKWAAKRARKGNAVPTLMVVRFVKPKGAPEGASPADALKRGIPPGRGSMLRFQPKSVWEYAERMVWGKKEVTLDDPEFRVSRKKSHKAHVRIYKQHARGGRNAEKNQLMVVAAKIERTDIEDDTFGVIFWMTAADEKDGMGAIKSCIRRFRILDDDDEEEDGSDSDADIFVDSESKPEIWREARKKKIGNLKNWAAFDTKNYLIVYNKKVKRSLLKKVGKHIEAIRAQVYEKLFPPAREIKAVSVVRVCKDMQEYHRYGGPPGSAGYWSRGDEELVIPGDMAKDSLRVLYHEAFHQYIHYAVGDVAPHSWFNEGHGDYFAGHNYAAKKFKAAPFRWRTGTITNAFAQETYVPLKKFLKYTQREYYANAGLCYAQGWSLVYFLREVERKKVKKYKQYWGLLDRYFAAIKANVKTVKENAFEGLDPKKDPKPDKEPEPEADPKKDPEPPALPRLPGLDQPFPGEHPEAGAGKDPKAERKVEETKSVAGPKITGVKSALDAAVDQALGKIDIEQLQKDWIEWSK